MKFKKVETEILLEALENNICFHGAKTEYLIASYIGAVEVVVGERWNYDEKSYETEYYLAVQLPSGEILGVENNNKVFSLHGHLYTIHWGEYPIGFPDKLKTRRPCPNVFKPRYDVPVTGATVDLNDLPF